MTLRCTAATLALVAITTFSPPGRIIPGQQAARPAKPQVAPSPSGVRFTDIRKAAGIEFVQDSTQTEEKYYLETMGTGVAWIDYDQDGLMDIYFLQSAATDAYKPSHPLRSVLYHNNGDGTFTDVTEKARVGGEGHYGQGVAVGDFDNDGYPDIYIGNDFHENDSSTSTSTTAHLKKRHAPTSCIPASIPWGWTWQT